MYFVTNDLPYITVSKSADYYGPRKRCRIFIPSITCKFMAIDSGTSLEIRANPYTAMIMLLNEGRGLERTLKLDGSPGHKSRYMNISLPAMLTGRYYLVSHASNEFTFQMIQLPGVWPME